jgi:TldD protein
MLDPREGDPVARAVALTAVQVARDAGATYADVRVDAAINQTVGVWDHAAPWPVMYSDDFLYGVRVIANGQWGFAGGQDPSPDAVARVARRAVHQATVDAAGRASPVVLAPAPAVPDGTWETPIEIDPFTVSIADQQAALAAGIDAALKVKGVKAASATLDFSRVVRTFASSEGSFIVQTLYRAYPGGGVHAVLANDPRQWVGRQVATLEPAGGGFEVVRAAGLADGFAAAAHAVVAGASPRRLDVGRYDVVVSASVMASLVGGTLGRAASLDRASGRDASFGGTSFAAPPNTILGGDPLASHLVTITANRSMPRGLATVRWDDEGVEPEEFPIIAAGNLVDYLTTRESAPSLGWWYDKHGRPVRSHGCAMGGGLETPMEGSPNLVMRPGSSAVSVDDLIRDVKKGVFFSDDGGGGTDVQVLNGRWSATAAQEIRNGKLVGYVRDVAMEFRTPELWKSLDAVGGAASAESCGCGVRTVRAVPGRFRQVRVTSMEST